MQYRTKDYLLKSEVYIIIYNAMNNFNKVMLFQIIAKR